MTSGKRHILKRVVQGVIIALVLIQLAACLVFQIPSVQTSAARTVTEVIGDRINGDITIGSVNLVPFNRLILKDVTVCGHGAPAPWGDSDTCFFHNPGDTLGHIGKLAVTFSVIDFLSGRMGVRRVMLENGFFNLMTEGADMSSNLTRIFNLPLSDPDMEHPVFPDIFASDVRLENCGFSLCNPYVQGEHHRISGQMHYNNLIIKNICAHFKDFRTVDGEINCRILGISADEASGARIENMTGQFHLGPRGSGMDDMYLKDGIGSVVEADHLYFKYSSKEEVADWVNSVVMDVKFRETVFDFNSIRYFVPTMATNHLKLTVKGGEVEGPVSDIKARNLEVFLTGTSTSVRVDAELKGIPDIPNTTLDGKITDVLHTEDAAAVVSGWTGMPAPEALKSIAGGRTIYQNVSLSGPFRNMNISGTMRLNDGLLKHDVTLSLFTPAGLVLGGSLEADSLDLGYALDNDVFGKTDFKLKGRFQSGDGTNVGVEYLNIGRLGFNGYDYRNMTLSGEVSDTVCHAWFVSRDSSLRLDLEADAFIRGDGDNLSGTYSLLLDAPYADLKNLNLINSTESSLLSGMKLRMDIDFDGTENAVGRIRIDDLSYTNARGVIAFDSLSVVSFGDNTGYGVDLRSPYADVTYRGRDPLLVALLRAKDVVIDRQFGDVFGGRDPLVSDLEHKGNDTLKIRTHDIWKLSSVLTDGLYLSEGTNLQMTVSDSDSLALELHSGRLARKSSYLKDLCLRVDTPDSVVKVNITSSEIKAGGLSIVDNNADILLENGLVNLDYMFHDGYGDVGKPMFLSTDLSFSRDKDGSLTTGVAMDSVVLFINGTKWMLDSTRMSLGDHLISVDGFNFHGHTASLKVNGVISDHPEDEMKIGLDSLDLSLVNKLLPGDIALDGNVTGFLDLKDFYGKSHFVTDINGTGISISGRPLGDIRIMSKWDPSRERINLLVSSRHQDRTPINLTGYYKHADRDLFVNASLNELSVAYAGPFLKDVLRIDGGDLSGNIILHGSHGKYSIDSENTRFRNFAFAPVYTEVPYLMNGGMKFTEDRIDMDGVIIEDKNGNRAALTGTVSHDFLRDMKLDVRLAFNNLECVDIKEKAGVPFYGTASASGTVSVTGPVNDILISAVIRTGENTSIHVPLTNSYAASSNDILVFRNYRKGPVDPYDSLMTAKPADVAETAKIRIKADATLYDDALLTVELDKNLGNIVECHGNARVNLDIDPLTAKTDVRGDYTITSGLARYSFAGIIARDFSLVEGGKLTFRGPLASTYLNLGATYHTKTSVATLVADTSSIGTRQNVYASVGLKGNLSNPTFSFKFDIPDLDPLTKGRVETAFSTDAKIQKQFMALMITGGFIPDEQSGVTEDSNILYSNVSEMISNHVNNILRTLDIPLDVGLNYQRTSRRDNMIDVNMSYQAFNNRLILNGSVGNGSRNQNWAGNFEAQLKMDRRGKFRFSLFTRAADQYTNFIDNSQRNGLGFSFQDEFNRFGEIFMSRRKKEAEELERIEQVKEELLEELEQKESKEAEE